MAIIKCPECRHEVSDKARSCPFCGTSIAGNLITCPDCGKILLRSTKTCPNCSCSLEDTHIPHTITDIGRHQPNTPVSQHTSSNTYRKPTGLIILCLLLAVAVMACGWMWYRAQQYNEMLTSYISLRDNGSVKDHTDYVDRYPTSPFVQEIKEKASQLSEAHKEWDHISASSDKTDYINFLYSHIHSPYTQLCINRIDSLEWLDANGDNTIESYTKYISQHSHGKYTSLAKQCIENLNNLIPSAEEKAMANNLVNTYFEQVNRRDAAGMRKILTEKQFQNTSDFISTLRPDDRWDIASGLSVSKSLSATPGQYIIVVRFKAIKTSDAGNTARKETYSVNTIIYGGTRISMMKFQPVESPSED